MINLRASNSWPLFVSSVYKIHNILHEKLKKTSYLHNRLLNSLDGVGWLNATAFVSFNYDILIDNALLDFRGESGFHYSIPFVNQAPSVAVTTGRPVPLFKLHGSLNCLYCSAC